MQALDAFSRVALQSLLQAWLRGELPLHADIPHEIEEIDGQFIRNLISNPLDQAAVRCFADVARLMGLETVAEFVESPEVLLRLKEMGVDYAQGNLEHRPEPIDRLTDIATRAGATAL